MKSTFAFSSVAVLLFAAAGWGQFSLSTTYASNNGQSGNMFDIQATQSVRVESFDVNLDSGFTGTVEIYAVTGGGSFQGWETSAFKWTLLASVNVTSAGQDIPTPLGLDLGVDIPAGGTQGFYVTTVGSGINYTTGSSYGMPFVSDDSITVLEGVGKTYPFGATFGGGTSSRIWNGTVHYSLSPCRDDQTFLETTFVSNNAAPGNMFDVVANQALTLSSVDINTAASPVDVEIYAVTGGGSFVGHEDTPGDWTLVGSVTGLVTVGLASPNPVPISLNLTLAAGDVLGLYVTLTDNGTNLGYTNGINSGGVTASDSNLSILEGVGKLYPFSSTFGTTTPGGASRIWNGRLHYTISNSPNFFEDFSSASGTTPPLGWTRNVLTGDPVDDGWRWDNPNSVTVNAPMVEPTAICDTDFTGPGQPVVSELVSPIFDASRGPVVLSWDQVHRPLGSTVTVDVFGTAGWTNVYTNSTGTPDPDSQSIDITAASGGQSSARVRFVYDGEFDWWWLVDNVRVQTLNLGQPPQPFIAVLDVNNSSNAARQPVCAANPVGGPFFVDVPAFSSIDLHFEGEGNQPLVLFAGDLNVGVADFAPFGQLDLGVVDPMGGLSQITVLGDGNQSGFVNQLFRIHPNGSLDLSFPVPGYLGGTALTFQSVIFNSTALVGISNAVEMTFLP